MKWRRWNNILHRDLGYLCFGLTIIYAISGVAVNHIADWNPNYTMERIESRLDLSVLQGRSGQALAKAVLEHLGERGKLKNSFQPEPDIFKIFAEGNTISVNLSSGLVLQEKAQTRPVLHQMNFLHLNHPKKLWTWFADLYAVALGCLAITGLFVLRGKKGITGRGAWLTSLGIALPVLFLLLYF